MSGLKLRAATRYNPLNPSPRRNAFGLVERIYFFFLFFYDGLGNKEYTPRCENWSVENGFL
jgi:hypothetical protein